VPDDQLSAEQLEVLKAMGAYVEAAAACRKLLRVLHGALTHGLHHNRKALVEAWQETAKVLDAIDVKGIEQPAPMRLTSLLARELRLWHDLHGPNLHTQKLLAEFEQFAANAGGAA
jgi:hypothetical protein